MPQGQTIDSMGPPNTFWYEKRSHILTCPAFRSSQSFCLKGTYLAAHGGNQYIISGFRCWSLLNTLGSTPSSRRRPFLNLHIATVARLWTGMYFHNNLFCLIFSSLQHNKPPSSLSKIAAMVDNRIITSDSQGMNTVLRELIVGIGIVDQLTSANSGHCLAKRKIRTRPML
jgi:hypothetical protein